MEQRIKNYQHNIRTIRASGCTVPTTAMVDSLDPVEIEMRFLDNAESLTRMKRLIDDLGDQQPE